MKLRLRTGIFRGKMKTEQLAELSFILFFSEALLRTLVTGVLGQRHISSWIGMLLPYVPLFLICVRNPRRYIKVDFIVIFILVLVFFATTLLLHPEYEPYYRRSNYGVWDHVLKPYRGIYAYLFIRLIDDPKRILNCMKISGWVMLPYFFYRVYRGSWSTVTATGANMEATYSVTFGYEVLIFALIFLYLSLTEKKSIYIITAVIDIILMLVGGSRGPILFVGLFFVLYILIYTQNIRRKGLVVFLIIAGSLLVYIFYNPILVLLINILDYFHLSSRFLRMLLAGTISDDSNRFNIWNASIQMIKNNPFGYGAMGSRHEIINYIFAGYPHSIILEFLIDYGVILGSFLLIVIFGYAFSILFSRKKRDWCDVFLPFFCAACSMFISLTYWSRAEYWSCLALGVCCFHDMRRRRTT